jgi:hypothetical protein
MVQIHSSPPESPNTLKTPEKAPYLAAMVGRFCVYLKANPKDKNSPGRSPIASNAAVSPTIAALLIPYVADARKESPGDSWKTCCDQNLSQQLSTALVAERSI